MTTIKNLTVRDIRFPTSRSLDGSDAMNAAPDYSAAYVILETDTPDLAGHGLTFTIGRGTEIVVAAVHALAPLVVGKRLEDIAADMGGFWRTFTGDSQLRWIGPDKGAIHLATAAVVNAVWDLWAKSEKEAGVEAARGHEPGRTRAMPRLPLCHRRDHAVRSARLAQAQSGNAGRTRTGNARAGISGVHHVRRMARLRRRQDSPFGTRRRCRRLDSLQAESGRQY